MNKHTINVAVTPDWRIVSVEDEGGKFHFELQRRRFFVFWKWRTVVKWTKDENGEAKILPLDK